MGDRTFHAPAVVLQQRAEGIEGAVALIPDVVSMNQNAVGCSGCRTTDGLQNSRWGIPQGHPNVTTFPSAADVELSGTLPVLSFGLMDYVTEQHVYFRHPNDGSMQRTLLSAPGGDCVRLRYGYQLRLQADGAADERLMYQQAATSLWRQSSIGSDLLSHPKPQMSPMVAIANRSYAAAVAFRPHTGFDTEGAFVEFELGGQQVGGLRSMQGAPGSIVYSRIFNSPWWNTAHMALGMYAWSQTQYAGGSAKGEANSQADRDPLDLRRRALLMVNFTLASPRAPDGQGLWSTNCYFNESTRSCSVWAGALHEIPDSVPYDRHILPNPIWRPVHSSWFDAAGCSKTAALLLRFLDQADPIDRSQLAPRVLQFVTKYADWLLSEIGMDGSIAAWFKMADGASDGTVAVPVEWLRFNSHGGVHAWFLAELYRHTNTGAYLDAARSLGEFLLREILPQQRWADFETFYSCSEKPEASYDARSGQWPRNTLSMIWAVDGLVSLHELDKGNGSSDWLGAAERVSDYMSLYQAVWSPETLGSPASAYVFGGFTSQNSDSEWLDARQSNAAEALLRVGLQAGRVDLLERGAAALRAGFALVTDQRGVMNGVFPVQNLPPSAGRPFVPAGLEPENIDHEGIPQLPARSGPDWGEVGALSAAGTFLKELGGVYIDIARNMSVGVDGVAVASVVFDDDQGGRRIGIELVNLIGSSSLPAAPFVDTFEVPLKVVGIGPGSDHVSIEVNGRLQIVASVADLRLGRAIIQVFNA
eukprot:TRINITY_DN3721_c0_g3_i2.p1 TRINITY_DN3721_c0_g3~~TRINITY_DN3721_c0_g3_i2.p1  ORF type:complete len:759 (-),score=111.50 TRINITY_DN3721_c0_g3_i2:179-2455(-)